MRRFWVNFQCRGVLLICMIVGQGPAALAVGAGGGCLDIFTLICPISPLSPSLWEVARYRLKYCLKGPLNPQQPTNQSFFSLLSLFFLSLFFLICFSDLCQICQRVILLNLLDNNVNPNCLLFHRERESPKSSCEGVVGWCDGAWKIFRAEASY